MSKKKQGQDITQKLSYNLFTNTKCSPSLGVLLYLGPLCYSLPKGCSQFLHLILGTINHFWLLPGKEQAACAHL